MPPRPSLLLDEARVVQPITSVYAQQVGSCPQGGDIHVPVPGPLVPALQHEPAHGIQQFDPDRAGGPVKVQGDALRGQGGQAAWRWWSSSSMSLSLLISDRECPLFL